MNKLYREYIELFLTSAIKHAEMAYFDFEMTIASDMRITSSAHAKEVMHANMANVSKYDIDITSIYLPMRFGIDERINSDIAIDLSSYASNSMISSNFINSIARIRLADIRSIFMSSQDDIWSTFDIKPNKYMARPFEVSQNISLKISKFNLYSGTFVYFIATYDALSMTDVDAGEYIAMNMQMDMRITSNEFTNASSKDIINR